MTDRELDVDENLRLAWKRIEYNFTKTKDFRIKHINWDEIRRWEEYDPRQRYYRFDDPNSPLYVK